MLIEALARVFGAEAFDATDVYGACGDQELLAAIEAEIPRARRRRRGKPAELNTRAIRIGLRRLNGIKAHHKIARILHGDPNFEEHWADVAGYAERVVRTLRER
jgi:hypothetical protein